MDLSKELYSMKLGDHYDWHSRSRSQRYTRVPGGRIWQTQTHDRELVQALFIPYNTEFDRKEIQLNRVIQ